MLQSRSMRLHCANIPSFLLIFLVLSLLQTPTQATKKPYIVYLGSHSHGPNPSSTDLERATSSHYSFLGSYLESDEKVRDAIFYSYTRHINGFAAILDDTKAAEIAKHPNVVSIFLDKGMKLHTTRSWDFLRLETNGGIPSDSIWNKARYGEDTIIGNIDFGVWPESKSFSGEGFGPVPSKWRGICQDGVKDGVRCNRKLIGARYFNKGYIAYSKANNFTFSIQHNPYLFSTRDYNGHGTHTLSTAGGNFVRRANVFGYGNGTAKGGSPRARVAAYKVCWPVINEHECFEADVIAAFDAAINDGVDVLSVSLGTDSPSEFFDSSISIGAFHAVANGITVVTSAGNEGPGPETVTNVPPWLVTVGASTIDRDFTSYIALGDKKHLKGASLSSSALPSEKFYPLISGADAKAAKASTSDAQQCKRGALDPKKVKGNILVCVWGKFARSEMGEQAFHSGAVGMILANDIRRWNDVIADPHLLPASHINFTDGEFIFEYLNSTKTPMAYMTRVKTQLGVKPAPLVAFFSSRGPNLIEPTILKPDLTAPGVSIIAAYSEGTGALEVTTDERRVPFNIKSGTSMSCPHISGVIGLLKTLHPYWSPAALRSAIMTTARTRDSNREQMLDAATMQRATPFAYGAGHVQPNRAMDPGLVYDLTIDDYLNLLCAHGYNETTIKLFSNKPYKCSKSFTLVNFNYPSIAVPNLGSEQVNIVTRKVKNVGIPGTYTAYVKAPAGVSVSVKPKTLKFKRIGEEKTFKIIMKPKIAGKPRDYVFGWLKWSDGKHCVRSHIVVKHK
ncbi:subtilisin-like protease SBT5.4 isoform X1 [Morus notabilis]|uniref:subtilisin-like protease SBT5.4 isoform X1 n=2 Tax=Morus notabilis TaxID=981085 RepID=UPI000CED25E9|nr:subtilisin-like protease SBT5.4 isoform X1 [Morus notabilis]